MNVIEREAKQFIQEFYDGFKTNTIENLKDDLTSQLYNFNRDIDKLDFLKILLSDSIRERESHNCNNPGCTFQYDRENGIFVIEQEIDSINEYYHFEPLDKDKFSTEEESSLHSKLNEIMETLEKQSHGQEIIFEELESLKSHFKLGEKTWFQLLKGKLYDLFIKKALDETVIKHIWSELSDDFTNHTNIIDNI